MSAGYSRMGAPGAAIGAKHMCPRDWKMYSGEYSTSSALVRDTDRAERRSSVRDAL